jgi:hypothetical protein
MTDSPAPAQYEPPAVTFHGRVDELTGSTSAMVGARVVRFAAAFATSLHVPVPSSGDVSTGTGSGGTPPGAPGGGGAGGGLPGGGAAPGGGAGGGGGGGKLPFTGLAVIAVSGAGAALASAGAALRRFVRRDGAGRD